MDRMPRELHFSHSNTRFRAILVDNFNSGSASDEECCICGHQLNHLAYYTTEPSIFYVHVACALRHPDLPGFVPRTFPPSADVRARSLFSALLPYSGSDPVSPPYIGHPSHSQALMPCYSCSHPRPYASYAPPPVGSSSDCSDQHGGGRAGKILGAVGKGALKVFLQVLIVATLAVIV